MKISIDNEELFTLSETQKSVIMDEIPSEIFEDDIKRRIKWILIEEKYERCMKKLKEKWIPKLKERGIKLIPTDDIELAELILSQSDYKNRSERELNKLV